MSAAVVERPSEPRYRSGGRKDARKDHRLVGKGLIGGIQRPALTAPDIKHRSRENGTVDDRLAAEWPEHESYHPLGPCQRRNPHEDAAQRCRRQTAPPPPPIKKRGSDAVSKLFYRLCVQHPRFLPEIDHSGDYAIPAFRKFTHTKAFLSDDLPLSVLAMKLYIAETSTLRRSGANVFCILTSA